ncbi:alpha/beta hydrolase [Arenibacter sp. GZD96]|uniref:alpha/beta fold hydrolase n=1 Tax=Aurantibrevibacter litoralis TaxID=3106030 RepID=UPI002AFF38C2|nr:alpha/beta hydrolase [Arenibacter sp. GZD-96]MEA1786649.1 alpha/beta hydrolase [Arenibacter sp. GZD-96]
MKTLKNVLAFFFFSITLGVVAQNVAFHVSVSGKGEPLLFFPGFTCTGEVWEDTVAELSKNYECHVFTFAGFGEVAPIEKPWLPKIKEEIEAYVSAKALKNPVIIGHSLGGTLGLWLASEENHPYKKIIVVDALPSTGALMMPDFKSEYIVYDNPYNKQLLEMDSLSFDKMAQQMAMGMTLNTEGQKKVKEWMLLADRETYVFGYTDLLKLDLREDIAKINIPVTILAATQPYGKETVETTYQGQYAKLANYSIKFADESAHFIMYDQPEWFINNVKEEL